ncbi:hypothetical protein HYW67_01535 [Candidatus Parcubacteria bacterium]|nr:hypothetical protein [Candidatus Parcubacteria bacterium]
MTDELVTLLGLFQSSHYDRAVFRSWLARHPTPADWALFRDRVKLVWTRKARMLSWVARIVSLGRTSRLPQAVLLAQQLLRPVEAAATWWLAQLARRTLRRARPVVIGIVGSYGKTTTKEILAHVLSGHFRVHRTPENVNTLLGIAAWLRRLAIEPEGVLIVEMGAYRRGDIERIARLVRPTIGILTGINEAHLERFGSLEETKAAKCELFDVLPASVGRAFWNRDSALAQEAVAECSARWHERGTELVPYTASGTATIQLYVGAAQETSLRVRAEKITESTSPPWLFETDVKLMGIHHAAAIAVAVAVADALSVPEGAIARGLATLRPLLRRLAPSHVSGGRFIVDDSYNITLDGVRAALDALQTIPRRKIGVFAGIPEVGREAERINRELGRLIASAFDAILLHDTPVRAAILDGLREGGFDAANCIRYTDSAEVEAILQRIVRDGDCVYLSAYDWPAIYL